MTVCIQISGQISGRTWIFEGRKQTGQKRLVPTYRLVLSVELDTGFVPDKFFSITRDTSPVIFSDGVCHYGTDGECPPSASTTPYQAIWHNYGNLPNALRLYELHLGEAALKGIGSVMRHGILIHSGPARSEGCFTIAGGRKAYPIFEAAVREFERLSKKAEILVHVSPRHFGPDNPLSCV